VELTFPIDTERPTRAEIRLGALRRNLARAKALAGPGALVMAIVKANAYGHGIVRVARELLDSGADRLGVAFLEEGMFLRAAGVRAPILVLGAINVRQVPLLLAHDLEFALPSVEKAEAVSAEATKAGTKARVHLKFDTGMERIGVHWYSAAPFVERALSLPGLEVVGAFSHFARADDDRDFSARQIERFERVLDRFRALGGLPPLVHLANSAGLVNFPEARYSMVRPGIMLYGVEPTPLARVGVEPVMRLLTKVAYFKVTKAGDGISYGHTYVPGRDTRIATLPVGYGDGYPRTLSNRSGVIIRGRKYRQVGNVCMDQMMVDLGPDGTAYNDDDALLFGERGGDVLPVEELCDAIGTIPYELLCAVSARVPRIYVEE
jgi:alanine racemase